MNWSRRLQRFLASSGSFIVSFVFSALSFEMGPGYAEYLPTALGPDPDHETDEDGK